MATAPIRRFLSMFPAMGVAKSPAVGRALETGIPECTADVSASSK